MYVRRWNLANVRNGSVNLFYCDDGRSLNCLMIEIGSGLFRGTK
jgi:hypothetical protein